MFRAPVRATSNTKATANESSVHSGKKKILPFVPYGTSQNEKNPDILGLKPL